jgi:uncharacterized membrane protein YphA (DoxX/SURF4 family)
MINDIFLALRTGLAVMFVFAGASKLAHLPAFSTAIAEYRIVPVKLQGAAAAALAVLEVLVGLGLLVGLQFAALLGGMVLLAFSVAVSINLFRGRAFDCGCGFGSDTPISWSLVARDLALAGLAGLVFMGPASSLAIAGPSVTTWLHASATPATQALPVPMVIILVGIGARLWAATDTPRLTGEALTYFTHSFRRRKQQHDGMENPAL